MNWKKIKRVIVVALAVIFVAAPFANARYADKGNVVFSTQLDGMTKVKLMELIGEPGTPGEPGECGCECTCQSCAFLKAHPVGDIWMTVSDTDPNEVYGGEWERWGQGRVPVGVGDGDDGVNPPRTFEEDETGGWYGGTDIPAEVTLSGVPVIGTIPTSGFSGAVTLSNGTVTVDNTGNILAGAPEITNADHKLTVAEMPAHSHQFRERTGGSAAGNGGGFQLWDGYNYSAWRGAANPTSAVAGTYFEIAANGGDGVHKHANTVTKGTLETVDHNHTASVGTATSHTLSVTASGTQLTATGTGTATIADATVQPYITCYMWKRMPGTGDDKCTGGPCGCGGGSGGTGGDCSCTGCDGTCETMAVPDYDSEYALIDKAPDSTTGTTIRTWEAPYTGFVSVYTAVGNTTNAVAMSIYINDIRVSFRQNSSSSVNQYWYFQEPPIPVKEHDTIEVRITQGSFQNASTASFFPPVFIGAGCCANSSGTPGSGGTPADLSDYYTKAQVEALVANAVAAALEDYYTKTEVYSKTETYNKTEVYSKTETYTQAEVNALITALTNRVTTLENTTIRDKGSVGAGHNLNDYLTNGVWQWQAGNQTYNLPTNGPPGVTYGLLEVQNVAGYVVQTLTVFSTGDVWMRLLEGGVVKKAWTQLHP